MYLFVACIAELVDAIDSKSIFISGVPVQVRIQAPNLIITQEFYF